MRLTFLAALLFTSAIASQEKKPDPKKEPPPKVLYAVPLVAKPGEKQKLVLRGKGLAAVKEVKVVGADGASAKALAGKAVGVPNNYPAERVGDSEVEVELELPKDAKGVKLVAVGPGGESEAYPLLLRDELPVVAEKEENGAFDTAQEIKPPCAVEGTIKGERDVDVFKFAGTKGQKVRIEVQAARFGSPLDGFLTLHGPAPNGPARAVLEQIDDANGSLDPVITLTLPADGTCYLSLIDAHDFGGPNFGYRLVVKAE